MRELTPLVHMYPLKSTILFIVYVLFVYKRVNSYMYTSEAINTPRQCSKSVYLRQLGSKSPSTVWYRGK